MGRALPRRPKLAIPERAPDRLAGLLELLFLDHPERQSIAKRILEEVRKRGSQGLPEGEWIYRVLELLREEYPQEAEELIRLVQELDEEYSRTTVMKRLTEKLKEYDLEKEFHHVKNQYSLVLKILRRAGFIYKKEGAYYLSSRFGRVLQEIGQLWLDWRAGLVD